MRARNHAWTAADQSADVGMPRGDARTGVVVLWFAKNPTEALIIGQVVLSIGIPFAIIPLMKYTHDRSLMGDYVDGPVKFAINMVVVSLIVALNVILVILTLSGRS